MLDNTADGIPVRPLEIDDWPRSDLPWAAFWLKELLSWGTLDPVVAFLLARGNAANRVSAKQQADLYYQSLSDEDWLDPNEVLNPRKIRNWMFGSMERVAAQVPGRPEFAIHVRLDRAQEEYKNAHYQVFPIDAGESVTWIDSAGYNMGYSRKPDEWPVNSV